MTGFDKSYLPAPEQAITGREQEIDVLDSHFVNGHSIKENIPATLSVVYFGMGCFWGAERLFWQKEGVWTTAVGYMGGFTENPTYEEVCSGGTGHTEAVMVVYDSSLVSLEDLLRLFWESHDPTQE